MTIRHIEVQQVFCLQQSIPDMTGYDGYNLFNPYKRAHARI
jgi:hypothetical protein